MDGRRKNFKSERTQLIFIRMATTLKLRAEYNILPQSSKTV